MMSVSYPKSNYYLHSNIFKLIPTIDGTPVLEKPYLHSNIFKLIRFFGLHNLFTILYLHSNIFKLIRITVTPAESSVSAFTF